MCKKAVILLLAALLFFAAGCGGSRTPAEPGTYAPTDPQQSAEAPATSDTAAPIAPTPRHPVDLLTEDGSRAAAPDSDTLCTVTETGVFYSVFAPGGAPTGPAVYRWIDTAAREDVPLLTLEDQGYEAAYTRTELDGVIYTLATVGNAFDDKPDTLYLLAFDPAAETMTKYAVSADGFPYAAMAVSGGKLLIMNHEMNAAKADKVYEFDPASGTVREILSIPDDGKSSLRSVAGAEDGFYLLRLGLSGGMPEEMFLDRYDSAYQLTDSVSLNGLIIPAMKNLPGMEGEADVLTEFGLAAGGFAVQDGHWLFYENFGRIRVIIDLETGEALFADQDLWSMAHGGGEPAVYEIAFEPYGAGEGPKILTVKDGKTEMLSFQPDDSRFFLQNASCSADGTWLIRMADSAPAGMGEEILYLWK